MPPAPYWNTPRTLSHEGTSEAQQFSFNAQYQATISEHCSTRRLASRSAASPSIARLGKLVAHLVRQFSHDLFLDMFVRPVEVWDLPAKLSQDGPDPAETNGPLVA